MAANRFELLATWYLRFNGFFTTPDFTVHPNSRKKGGGTDADVLAVRFRHTTEYQARYMFERDPGLPAEAHAEFLICEVKAGVCAINDTWSVPANENVEYALRWMGFESKEDTLTAIAQTLYANGRWSSADKQTAVRMVCFGMSPHDPAKPLKPGVQQILHPHVIAYLRRRFTKGCVQIARQNWDKAIIEFAKYCEDRKIRDDELLAWANGGVITAAKS